MIWEVGSYLAQGLYLFSLSLAEAKGHLWGRETGGSRKDMHVAGLGGLSTCLDQSDSPVSLDGVMCVSSGHSFPSPL